MSGKETTEVARAVGRFEGIAECLSYIKEVEVLRLQDDLSPMEQVEMTLEIIADGIRDLYEAACREARARAGG